MNFVYEVVPNTDPPQIQKVDANDLVVAKFLLTPGNSPAEKRVDVSLVSGADPKDQSEWTYIGRIREAKPGEVPGWYPEPQADTHRDDLDHVARCWHTSQPSTLERRSLMSFRKIQSRIVTVQHAAHFIVSFGSIFTFLEGADIQVSAVVPNLNAPIAASVRIYAFES